MGNTISSFFHRFVLGEKRGGEGDDGDAPEEWGQVEYNEVDFRNQYSDEDLLTEDESCSGRDSFFTTDSSDDEGLVAGGMGDGVVTEGVGDRALQEAAVEDEVETEEESEVEVEVGEEEEDELQNYLMNENERLPERAIPVREGGRCLVVERQQLHGLQEILADGRTVCVCGVICSTQKNHRRHVEYVSKKGKFGCPHCPKVFMYLGYLNQHQRQTHNILPQGNQEEKTYACRNCTVEFCSISRLLLHRRTEHEDWKRLSNSEQGAEFDNSDGPVLRPDSSTVGQKRKLSARTAAKEQGRRKRVKTGLPQSERRDEEPSSTTRRRTRSAVQQEPKRRCSYCNKNLREWNKDFMKKNWNKFDFCCHETVHAWMMKD